VLFKIESKSGRLIESFSRHREEREVLFAPHARLMVKSSTQKGKILHVTPKEIVD